MNNEYIREYSTGLKLRKKRYIFNEEIIGVKDFTLLKEGCLSLLVEFLDGSYSIYFPYTKPSEWKKISKEEASDLKSRNFKVKLDRDDIPLLKKREKEKRDIIAVDSNKFESIFHSTNIALPVKDKVSVINISDLLKILESIKYFDFDCSGNFWMLKGNNKIYHYLDTLKYQRTRVTRRTLKSNSDKTQWSNLYINCERPEDTKIKVEVSCGDKTEEYDNCTNIYLYNFVGKKLKVVITLIRDDNDLEVTPVIYSVRAIANTNSYVDYLPAFYKQANDLDLETLYRFLAVFQELMRSLENDIQRSHKILSPQECDSEYLEWLSSLLGLTRDYRWKEENWRNFLDEAPVLYKILGTKACMERVIELYCDEIPVIDDDIDGKPFEFCVKLSNDKTKKQEDVDVIESIIWAFKPAYTSGRLYIDYSLNENKEYIVGQSVLPFNTEIK